ncbi:hypothetical protein [Leptospira brenneri]|uniref:hypothetical protein n=1 Tax=Leptospira brenneri TaxID=2023182 RepID=UPI001FD4234A|nr:hypothetical protein [Leptospira brenneri]
MISNTNRIYCFLLVICFLYDCQSQNIGLETKERKSSNFAESEIKETCPIPLALGSVYGTSISKFDQTVILSQIKILLGDLCDRSFSHLLSLIHPTKGLYVDAKGFWTLEEVEKDLKDPNGYFQVYYFDSETLDQKKGTVGNLTLRSVFLSTKQTIVDLYVGSSEEVEVKFRFPENPKLERYLINPSFIKWEKNWYLQRMF